MNYLVVGLGNPGEKYSKTRHNAGRFLLETAPAGFVVESFARRKDLKALWSKINRGNSMVPVLLPETFMNLSGGSVAGAVQKEKIDQIIVLHDDLDLALGKFKISVGKGDGGHNGVRSIMAVLPLEKIIRIRIGIGRAVKTSLWQKLFGRDKGANFVLAKFNSAELETLEQLRPRVFEAIMAIIQTGVAKAMNDFN